MSTEQEHHEVDICWNVTNQAEHDRLINMLLALKEGRTIVFRVQEWRKVRDRLIDWYPQPNGTYLCEVKAPEQIQALFDVRFLAMTGVGILISLITMLFTPEEWFTPLTSLFFFTAASVLYVVFTYGIYSIEAYPVEQRPRYPFPRPNPSSLPLSPIAQTTVMVLLVLLPATLLFNAYVNLAYEFTLWLAPLAALDRAEAIAFFIGLILPTMWWLLKIWLHFRKCLTIAWVKQKQYSYS